MHKLLAMTAGQIFPFPKTNEDLTSACPDLTMTLRGGQLSGGSPATHIPEVPAAGKRRVHADGDREADSRGHVYTAAGWQG